MVVVAALMLAVSACSTPPADPPVIRTVPVSRPLPEAAKQPCRTPLRLPGRALTASEVTRYWGGDRAALVECETRRKAAVEGTE